MGGEVGQEKPVFGQNQTTKKSANAFYYMLSGLVNAELQAEFITASVMQKIIGAAS